MNRDLQYCLRCCLPETSEGINFDEMGICQACRSSEQKMRINWKEREGKLLKILEEAKANSGDNYDCIVPISGGKDSSYQLHLLVKRFGMKPLALTFSHNWFTETGKYNLWNILEKLSVDHIMFTPNRSLVNRLARRSLDKIGDSCWHCHAGIPAFALSMALKLNIKLLIWGESTSEFGSKSCYLDGPIEFDETYYLKVSSKVDASEMESEAISSKDLYPFRLPLSEQLRKARIRGIHLGDYIFWDGEKQVEFIKQKYGWKEDYVEGTYKGYKSVECRMPGVHDYAKFIKRGFGRTTDHASIDVRNGLLNREEAFGLIKKLDGQRPPALDYYLEITGLTEEEFLRILIEQRKGKAKNLPPVLPSEKTEATS